MNFKKDKLKVFFSLKRRQEVNSLFFLFKSKSEIIHKINIRDLDYIESVKDGNDVNTLLALSFIDEKNRELVIKKIEKESQLSNYVIKDLNNHEPQEKFMNELIDDILNKEIL